MGKLDEFLTGKSGYFRENEEDNFPWTSKEQSVWYALMTVEDGKIHR
jgi:hypothetical protein